MSEAATANETEVVLFDGDCNVCNRSVQFVLKRDPRGRFRFASLQSEAGGAELLRCGHTGEIPDSIVLVTSTRVWFRTGAVLRIARRLTWPWPVLQVLLLVPRPLRDFFYNAFAARRYRWFGRVDKCLVPSPEVRARFLDAEERHS